MRFAPNVPWAWKSFWAHPVELLVDEAPVEARFGRFGDSANFDARWVHGLQRMYHWIESHFWMELLGGEAQEETRFGPFGNSVSVGAI